MGKTKSSLPKIAKIAETSFDKPRNKYVNDESFDSYTFSLSGSKTPTVPKPIDEWAYKKPTSKFSPLLTLTNLEGKKARLKPISVENSSENDLNKSRTEQIFAFKFSTPLGTKSRIPLVIENDEEKFRSKSTVPTLVKDFRINSRIHGALKDINEPIASKSNPKSISTLKNLNNPKPMSVAEKIDLEELFGSKMKLASKKVQCKLDKLERGLFSDDFDYQILSPSLPIGNSRLLTNPGLEKLLSKKKGKKRKKAKSRKS